MTNLTFYSPKKNPTYISRPYEETIINNAIKTSVPAILVVYGRRRVGKTELIEQTLRSRSLLKFEGIQDKDTVYQIKRCFNQLAKYTGNKLYSELNYNQWNSFFEKLCEILEEHKGEVTIYFEELQWLACYDTEFISELKYFWDNRIKNIKGLLLILCGSSPSFMINKVVKSKALYNRSLYAVPVSTFNISETKQFLGPKYKNEDVLEAYLSVGGLPEYLKYLKQGSSILTSLCEHSFTSAGFFVNEIERIFISSFSEKSSYKKVIETLACNKYLSRGQIATLAKTPEGGGLTEVLSDLEVCKFIDKYTPFYSDSNSRINRYCIIDNYLQFFYKFISPKLKEINKGKYNSSPLSALPLQSYRIFRGYAFERFCREIEPKIATILGFSGIEYTNGPHFDRQTLSTGYQIDLLYERKDRVYTICEIKYQDSPLGVSCFNEVQKKLENFTPKKNYRTQLVLITAGPVQQSLKTGAYFDRIISLDDLIN